MVELLAPEHAGHGLAHDVGLIGVERVRCDGRVELVGFLLASQDDFLESLSEWTGAVGRSQRGRGNLREAEPNDLALAGADAQVIVRGGFRPLLVRVHGVTLAVDEVVVDAVLDVRAAAGSSEDALRVGLVLREQEGRVSLAIEVALSQAGIHGLDHASGRPDLVQQRTLDVALPGPPVSKPERRQHVQLGRLRAAIVDADLDQDVFRGRLRILDEDVEVTILVEHVRIEQLVLELVPAAATVGLHQIRVGEGGLRVLVEILHVGVRRGAVEVKVVLLDVLTVIGFAVGEAEQTLLENRILAVPQGQREAQLLLVVGKTGQAVFPPTIGAGARLVVAEVLPRVAAFAVILANGAPLPLAQIRAPLLPGKASLAVRFESKVLCCHGRSFQLFRTVAQGRACNAPAPDRGRCPRWGGTVGDCARDRQRWAGSRNCPRDPAPPTAGSAAPRRRPRDASSAGSGPPPDWPRPSGNPSAGHPAFPPTAPPRARQPPREAFSGSPRWLCRGGRGGRGAPPLGL